MLLTMLSLAGLTANALTETVKADPAYVTINVNDAAGLAYGVVIINTEDGYVFVKDGENKVDISQFEGGLEFYQFLPNVEESYSMVSVTLNGEDVTESSYNPDEGNYIVRPANPGDVLDINVAQVQRKDLMVLYISGIENVTYPYVYNTFAAANLGGELKEGYQNVYFNEAFDCPLMFGYESLGDGMQAYVYYNNTPILYDWGYNLPAENYGVTKVYFAAEEPGFVSDNIVVRGSEKAPKILVDYVAEGYVVPLQRDMETAYTHTELPGTLAVLSAPEGDKYNEVYIDGELVLPDETGAYVYNMTKDQDILIYANDETVAPEEREDLMVLYISGIENVTNPYVYNSRGTTDLGGELKEGYQQVFFDQAFDCPLMFGYESLGDGMQAYVYCDNIPILYDWGYELPAENYSVTKAYFAAGDPGFVSDFIVVRGSTNAPKILVDYVAEGYVVPLQRGMETVYTHAELPGTLAVLSAPEGDKYNEVYIDLELVLPDETGAYVYYMTKDLDILIYANDETGISTIGVDADKASEVYNLQGIKVNGQDLPAGIYIVNGKKVAKF